jgi:hypothetical protein
VDVLASESAVTPDNLIDNAFVDDGMVEVPRLAGAYICPDLVG